MSGSHLAAKGKRDLPDGDEGRPRKKYFRQRAHCNPLADPVFDFPIEPEQVEWKEMYPSRPDDEKVAPVKFADIGCGYGGLTVSLAKEFPDKLVLGMEIRDKVTDYVRQRILDLREKHAGEYQNAAVVRTNAMKYLPNFFPKGQLEKIFICFPDPHFKKAKHKRRIVSKPMLADYSYVLADNAIVYTITDVLDLHEWMVKHFREHPLYEELSQEELDKDPVVPIVRNSTEEGKKVERNLGDKYLAVYRRLPRN